MVLTFVLGTPREYSGEGILLLAMEASDMDVVDELFNYIPELLDENYIELAEFILLPSAGDAASTVLMENNNNVENHPNNDNAYRKKEASYSTTYTSDNIINENMVVDDKKDDPVNILVKAKRGRPPSKPPSREVVEKRRKVGWFYHIFWIFGFIFNKLSPTGCQCPRKKANGRNE
jgi:hypothetical protein